MGYWHKAVHRVKQPKISAYFINSSAWFVFFSCFFYVWGSNDLSFATLVWAFFEKLWINWKDMLPRLHEKKKKKTCWIFLILIIHLCDSFECSVILSRVFCPLGFCNKRNSSLDSSLFWEVLWAHSKKSSSSSSWFKWLWQIHRFTVENWSLPMCDSTQLVCYQPHLCHCFLRALLGLVALLGIAGSSWRLNVFFPRSAWNVLNHRWLTGNWMSLLCVTANPKRSSTVSSSACRCFTFVLFYWLSISWQAACALFTKRGSDVKELIAATW